MIHTENFKTKTILLERENPARGNRWNIGLDIGYSAVKGFSPNSIYCFPAFAKKVPEGLVNVAKARDKDIQYRNSRTGEVWHVGEAAQDMCNTNDSELAIFGRQRYFSEMFQVIAEVGLAFGMLKNKFGARGDKELFVQTGLPPEYREMDSDDLIEALSGEHNFEVKIGARDWIPFQFTLKKENIGVPMDQPMGTLYSVACRGDGRPSKDASKYFNSNVLIMDAGFGTLDIYNISNGKIITKPETIDTMAMKEIFKRTIADIAKMHKKEISITGMQRVLATGTINVMEKKMVNGRKKRFSSEVGFSDYLEKNNKDVCIEALDRICNTYDGLVDHKYLIITGGTCSAWNSIIREYLAGMQTLAIVSGAENENLSPVFANARGYYMFALSSR